MVKFQSYQIAILLLLKSSSQKQSDQKPADRLFLQADETTGEHWIGNIMWDFGDLVTGGSLQSKAAQMSAEEPIEEESCPPGYKYEKDADAEDLDGNGKRLHMTDTNPFQKDTTEVDDERDRVKSYCVLIAKLEEEQPPAVEAAGPPLKVVQATAAEQKQEQLQQHQPAPYSSTAHSEGVFPVDEQDETKQKKEQENQEQQPPAPQPKKEEEAPPQAPAGPTPEELKAEQKRQEEAAAKAKEKQDKMKAEGEARKQQKEEQKKKDEEKQKKPEQPKEAPKAKEQPPPAPQPAAKTPTTDPKKDLKAKQLEDKIAQEKEKARQEQEKAQQEELKKQQEAAKKKQEQEQREKAADEKQRLKDEQEEKERKEQENQRRQRDKKLKEDEEKEKAAKKAKEEAEKLRKLQEEQRKKLKNRIVGDEAGHEEDEAKRKAKEREEDEQKRKEKEEQAKRDAAKKAKQDAEEKEKAAKKKQFEDEKAKTKKPAPEEKKEEPTPPPKQDSKENAKEEKKEEEVKVKQEKGKEDELSKEAPANPISDNDKDPVTHQTPAQKGQDELKSANGKAKLKDYLRYWINHKSATFESKPYPGTTPTPEQFEAQLEISQENLLQVLREFFQEAGDGVKNDVSSNRTPHDLKVCFDKVWPKYRNGDTNFMDANSDLRFEKFVGEVLSLLKKYRADKGEKWLGGGDPDNAPKGFAQDSGLGEIAFAQTTKK